MAQLKLTLRWPWLYGGHAGSVSLMMLGLLVSFILIAGAAISYLDRQSHEITNQAQSNKSFGLADSGVNYAVWLLNPEGGDMKPEELVAQMPDTAINHPIEKNGEILGTFTLSIVSWDAAKTELKLLSVGRGYANPDRCQTVAATLGPFREKGYRVVSWDQQSASVCPSDLPQLPSPLPQPSPILCGGAVDCPTGYECVIGSGICEPIASPSASPLPIAPANDRVSDAIDVPAGAPAFTDDITDTFGASLDSTMESRACHTIGRTVWYKVVPSQTEVITVDTAGSSFDTAVAAYVGNALPGSGQDPTAGCDDNNNDALPVNGSNRPDKTSRLSFVAISGQTYFIQVGGVNGEFGNLKISISQSLCATSGITLSDAAPITGTWSVTDCALPNMSLETLQSYQFTAVAGQQLDVTALDGFDYLRLYDSEGLVIQRESNCSSQTFGNEPCLAYQFDAAGTYVVVASTSVAAGSFSVAIANLTGYCPIGYWRLDDYNSDIHTTSDSSGYGHKLTLFGGLKLVEQYFPLPAFTNFYSLLSESPGVATGTWPLKLKYNMLTLSAWVNNNFESTPASISRYISLKNEVGVLRYDSSVGWQYYIKGRAPGDANDQIFSVSFGWGSETGNWVHVAGVWDGTELKLYLNGQLVAHQAPPAGTEILSSATGLDLSNSGVETMRGNLDDVRVYDRALTPAEIMKIAIAKAPVPRPGYCLAPPAVPANDDFAQAKVVTGATFNDEITDTYFATFETGEPTPNSCATSLGKSVWYRVTPGEDTRITVSTTGTDFDTVLGVYVGNSLGALTSVACNNDVTPFVDHTSLTKFVAVKGAAYYIQVSGAKDTTAASGHLKISFSLDAPSTNDNWASAAQATPGFDPYYGHVADAYVATMETGEPVPSCAANAGKSLWYKYTATDRSMISITTDNDYYGACGYDTVLGVYKGTVLNTLTPMWCNDDKFSGSGVCAATSFLSVSGETYYIQAAGHNITPTNDSLPLDIKITKQNCPATFLKINEESIQNSPLPGADTCWDPVRNRPFKEFTFQGTAGRLFSATLVGDAYSYPYMELRNADGVVLDTGFGCPAGDTSTSLYNRACINYEITKTDIYSVIVSLVQYPPSTGWYYTLTLDDFPLACPVAYWELDSVENGVDDDGNNYKYSSASVGSDMILIGNAILSTQHLPAPLFTNNNSMEFDKNMPASGSEDGMGMAFQDIDLTGNSVSMSAWVYHRSLPGSTKFQRYISFNNEIAVMRQTGSGPSGAGWNFYITAKEPSETSPSIKSIISSKAPAINTWYHVAAVWDGLAHQMRFYVNGLLTETKDLPAGTVIISPVQNISLSWNTQNHSEYFDGHIDDARIYNRALDEAEIGALAAAIPVPMSCLP